jgi:hypothetical protein
LLELPFKELIEQTGKVCLIDIVHPPDVISQVGDYKNVDLIEQDITGGLITEVWLKTGKYSLFKKLKSIEDIVIPEFKPDGDPGMVISLNILTQLESLLIDFLKKRSKIKEEEFSFSKLRYRRNILIFFVSTVQFLLLIMLKLLRTGLEVSRQFLLW